MVLIDTSVWIAYFNGKEESLPLNNLIKSNNICTNYIILAELLPTILYKNKNNLKELMLNINRLTMRTDWSKIIRMQEKNFAMGLYKIAINDLIIMQNAIDNDVELFTFNKDILEIADLHGLKIYNK